MADFDRYRAVLSEYNGLGRLEQTNNIDENVQQIAEALLLVAESTVPNKTVTIRPSTHPWITSHIRQLIRKRKHTFKQFKRTSDNHYWDKYKCIRNKIVSDIKVKVSHSLIAVGAVGVRVHCILGTADERRSPSLSFRCLILP